MSIDEILDEMDELLDRASSVPFAGHKCIIDGERVRELINDVRLNVPQEIKHAKMVEFDRDRIIKEAESRAEFIVREAEERAKNLTSEQAIIKEAKQRAMEAVTKAKQESDAIRSATDAYVEKRFQETEAYFSNTLKDVQQRKQQLQQLKANAKKKASAPNK